MKAISSIAAVTLLLLGCSGAPPNRHTVRIPAGIGNDVVITFGATNELVRVVFDHPGKEEFVVVEGTNVTLCLNVASDGAVYGMQTDWGHIDMIAHIVQQETGVTNICNPMAVVDGETNGIISAWDMLGRTDHRFTVNDERERSNTASHGTALPRRP